MWYSRLPQRRDNVVYPFATTKRQCGIRLLDRFSKYDRFSLKVCWIYSEFIGFLLLLEVMRLYLQFEIVPTRLFFF
jgi:hypothetical protein